LVKLNSSLPALYCKSETKKGNIMFKIISQRSGRVSLEISNSKTNWIPNDSLGDVFLFVGDKRTLMNLILVSKQFYHLLNSTQKDALIVQELKRRYPDFTLGYDLKSKNLSFFQIQILKYIDGKLKTAKLIQYPEEKAAALRNIAKEQAMVDVNEAKKTFVLARKAANSIYLSPYNKAKELRNIAKEQAMVDANEAKKTFHLAITSAIMIQDIYCKADALRGIALEQAKVDVNEAKKTFVRAIEAANLIQNSEIKAITLSKIAIDQAKVDVNEAKKTFVLAINTANLIQDIYCKADALRGIALEQAKVDMNEAKKTFVLAIKTAKLIQYSRTKAIALKRIAKDMEGGGVLIGNIKSKSSCSIL